MNRVAFTIDGPPKRKERPRFTVIEGSVRTHPTPEQAKAEKEIAEAAREAFGPGDPWTAPVRLTVTAIFAMPASWPKRYHDALANGATIYHDTTPDKDNIEKLVMDACNGIIWRDDSSVAIGATLKRYGYPERVEVVAELIVDAMGVPPMPTPSQLRAEKTPWRAILQARADAKAARQEAAKQRKAEGKTKFAGFRRKKGK